MSWKLAKPIYDVGRNYKRLSIRKVPMIVKANDQYYIINIFKPHSERGIQWFYSNEEEKDTLHHAERAYVIIWQPNILRI